MARWELWRGDDDPSCGSATIVLVLRGRLHADDVGQLRLPLRLVHDEPDVTRLVCDVEGLTRPDLGAVDALARLQLLARRLDRPLSLRGVSDVLHDLIELAGLVDHLPCVDGPRRS